MPIKRDAKGRFAANGGRASAKGKSGGGAKALAKRGADHVLAKSKAKPATKGAVTGESSKGSKAGFTRVSAKKKAADTAYMDRFLAASDAVKKKKKAAKSRKSNARAAAFGKAQAAQLAAANKRK